MSGFQGGRISQETFDEVVRENQDEFDMSLQEAIKDAIQQFQKQGVNLQNIDTTGGIGRQEMLDAMRQVHQLSVPVTDRAAALTALQSLQTYCDKSYMYIQRNLLLMYEQGGLNDLFLHVAPEEDDEVVVMAMKFIQDLSSQSGDVSLLTISTNATILLISLVTTT